MSNVTPDNEDFFGGFSDMMYSAAAGAAFMYVAFQLNPDWALFLVTGFITAGLYTDLKKFQNWRHQQ